MGRRYCSFHRGDKHIAIDDDDDDDDDDGTTLNRRRNMLLMVYLLLATLPGMRRPTYDIVIQFRMVGKVV